MAGARLQSDRIGKTGLSCYDGPCGLDHLINGDSLWTGPYATTKGWGHATAEVACAPTDWAVALALGR